VRRERRRSGRLSPPAPRRKLRAWRLAAALLCVAPCAHGQAWLPGGGSLDYSLSYSDVLNKKHYLPDGSEFDAGHTRTHTLGLSISWSPSDRFLLSVGIPYVRSEYHGSRPHAGTEIDDGDTRPTFTDARVELHFQALEVPVALAPYVAIVKPVNDYPVLGHAAPGRGLDEYWVGFFAGKSLDPWIPDAFVQLRYNHAFVEKVAGVAHDRRNADLEFGYFMTPRWMAKATLSWQGAHGGIDVPIPPSNPLYPYHDQIAAESFVHVGGGIAWFPSERFGLYASYVTALRGRNGHKVDHGVNLGVSFSPRYR
jgi:hypothetical protein